MDEFAIWLASVLQGIDGLTLAIVIILFVALMYAAKPDAAHRDSKRRNQAHRKP